MTEETKMILEEIISIRNGMSSMEKSLKNEITSIRTNMSGMEKSLKSEVISIRTDMSSMEKSLKNETTSIQLTLENEITPNIKAVAEAHLDLTRKLDEALKVEQEREMLLIRMNILENEMRKVKERLAEIA